MKRRVSALVLMVLFATMTEGGVLVRAGQSGQFDLKLGAAQVEEIDDRNPPEIHLPTSNSGGPGNSGTNSGNGVGSSKNQPGSLLVDPITLGAGVMILDMIVNLGKKAWDLVKAGAPTANYSTDVASAVPQGALSWTALQGWGNPVSKLYRAKLMQSENSEIGNYDFRVISIPNGNVDGTGKYLTGVSVMPAQLVIPYARNFSSKVTVTSVVNQGTKEEPVAGMLLHLEWAVDTIMSHAEQSVEIHIRGDGPVSLMTTSSNGSPEENVKAPVKVPAMSGGSENTPLVQEVIQP